VGESPKILGCEAVVNHLVGQIHFPASAAKEREPNPIWFCNRVFAGPTILCGFHDSNILQVSRSPLDA